MMARGTRTGRLLLLVLLHALALSAVEAQDEPLIDEITFEGNVRVNLSLIRNNLMTQVGAPYDDAAADEDIQMIFERFGLRAAFEPESVPEGIRVVVRLFEELPVRELDFRGIDDDEKEELRKLLGLDKGAFPRRYLFKTYTTKIRKHYQDDGYYFAEVRPVLEPVPDGVRLIFDVFTGEKVVIEEIHFEGLNEVSEGELRSVMESDTPTLWIFTDKLKEDVLNDDINKMNNYLREEGYLDARVTRDALKFNDEFDEVALHFQVQEGRRYHVKSIKVSGTSAFFPEQIHELIQLEPGDAFRQIKVGADIRRIMSFYRERGYIRAVVQGPILGYDQHEPLVDVTFAISEDKQKVLRDVVITGNSLTRDKVARREITLNPGDLFDYTEIQWSWNQLAMLRYFADEGGRPTVDMKPRATSDPQMEDLVIGVKEGGTGIFTFNVGLNTDTGLIGGIQVNKDNFDIADAPSSIWDFPSEFFGSRQAFHGGGQTMRLTLMPGTVTSTYSLLFVEPYLFDTQPYPISLSARIYRNEIEYSNFSERRTGIKPVLGKRLSRELSTSLGFRSELIELFNVSDTAPRNVREFEGKNGYRGIDTNITYQDFDNPRTPSKGFRTFVNYDYAGGPLGGDIDLSKIIVGGTVHQKAIELESGLKHIITFRGSVGWVEEHSDMDTVPGFERFYLGGATGFFPLRGFRWREAGPHDENGEPLGGTVAYSASLEYSVPIISEYVREYDAEESRLKGLVFFDIGSLGMSVSDPALTDRYRSAYGVGLKLSMPVLGGVPITIYYGIPLKIYDDDERQSFNISISHFF